MGTLVAKKYPAFFSKSPVDHTYVECGTGARGWKCWGGKIGGTAFKAGTASTKQANSVAQPDEKAGISCYGVNGVCHQAANRILVPARVLVSGARGYQVSQSLYGPYGRTLKLPFGKCPGLFNQFLGVTGDLPECLPKDRVSFTAIESAISLEELEREHVYADRLFSLHVDGERTFGIDGEDTRRFVQHQLAFFKEQVMYRLGRLFSDKRWSNLSKIREDIEQRRLPLERAYANDEMGPHAFGREFDQLTIQFQNLCANEMEQEEYLALFELKPGEVITLIDPEMLAGPGSATDPTPEA